MADMHIVRIEYNTGTKTLRVVGGAEEKLVTALDLSENVWTDTEFEQRVGYIVIAALSSMAGHPLGHRDYTGERNDAMPWILEHFRSRSEAGDESAVVTMVHELMASAVRNSDATELDRAEQLLREAADAGNSQAIEYLGTWLRHKQDLIMAIKRKSAS